MTCCCERSTNLVFECRHLRKWLSLSTSWQCLLARVILDQFLDTAMSKYFTVIHNDLAGSSVGMEGSLFQIWVASANTSAKLLLLRLSCQKADTFQFLWVTEPRWQLSLSWSAAEASADLEMLLSCARGLISPSFRKISNRTVFSALSGCVPTTCLAAYVCPQPSASVRLLTAWSTAGLGA